MCMDERRQKQKVIEFNENDKTQVKYKLLCFISRKYTKYCNNLDFYIALFDSLQDGCRK